MDPFLEACKDGRFNEVKSILEKTSPESRKELLDLRDTTLKNCLLWAAYHGDVETVQYLVTFKELNINCEDFEGNTAFMVALCPKKSLQTSPRTEECGLGDNLYSAEPTIRMIKTLYSANPDFVNHCNDFGVSPLGYSTGCQHLVVFKQLVDLGADVNYKNGDGETILHMAAMDVRMDIIRYLLKETNCDPNVRNKNGDLPCRVFSFRLVFRDITSIQFIDFAMSFSRLIHKKPLSETLDVLTMSIYCFSFSRRDTKIIFREIIKIVTANNPKKHLVQRLLEEAELENNFSLIILLTFENIQKSLNASGNNFYITQFELLKLQFMEELFSWYSKDAAFANELTAEISRIGWALCNTGAMLTLYRSTQSAPKRPKNNVTSNFAKMLLRHGLDISGTIEPGNSSTLQKCQHMKYLLDPTFCFGGVIYGCVQAFNESENWLQNHYRIFDGETVQREIPPLQELARISLRRHLFQNYNSELVLSFFNSVNIPVCLKDFLSFKC